MNNRSEIRDFMISRRATISSQQAGLPPHGTRRVPGLRRAEVAALADLDAGVLMEPMTCPRRAILRAALLGVTGTAAHHAAPMVTWRCCRVA